MQASKTKGDTGRFGIALCCWSLVPNTAHSARCESIVLSLIKAVSKSP